MRNSKRVFATAAVSLSALIAALSGAQAGGFALREQSAMGLGLSFAGAASGSAGLGSIFWNPATVTMNPGWQSQFNATLINVDGHITPQAGTSPLLTPLGSSGEFGFPALAPSSYSSAQISDSLWLGISTTAPYGLTTKSGPVWAGETYARTTKIMALNVNPIIGWKVTDWLSVGAGPSIQYSTLTVKRALIPTVGDNPNSALKADDVGVGFTAGVNITPWKGTDIGVGFRSSVHHELEGDLDITPGLLLPPHQNVGLKINTPELLTVGLSQYIGWGVTLHAGYEWTNWSRLKTLQVVNTDIGAVVSPFPLNWKDGHTYSLGLEYQMSPQWTVRVGTAYDDSPITTETRNPRLPDNDRIWASVGLGYKWSEKLAFDVGYSHLFIRSTPIRIVPGHEDYQTLGPVGLPFVANAEAAIDIVSVGLKYRWDDPKVAAPALAAAPIVRKY